jgi:diketogulonate reductase-like aldo/keto reductase
MQYRHLGRTRETIPVIGMGTWNMGSSLSQDAYSSQRESLRRGLQLGMNLIDTAEMYGGGKSEQLVGEAIKGRRDDVFIATKVSPDNLRYDDVLMACQESLRRLGVKYIDLYQIHWPNPSIPIRETMRAMETLVSEGKIRYIGVSNFSVQEMSEARDSLAKNELTSNQVEYNINSRSIEDQILPYCDKEKLTVIAYSPLSRGKIPSRLIPNELLKKYSMSAAQVMLNWVTYRNSVVGIPKASNVEHVEENARSVDVHISQADYQLLSSIFK